MKTIKYLLVAITLTFSFSLSAATRYVSDNIFIYLHSGPGLDYRITGTVKVGTPLKTLKYDSNSKFMKIKLPNGREGWVKNNELQTTPPAKTRLPAVKKELLAAQNKLSATIENNKNNLAVKAQSNNDLDELILSLRNDKSALEKTILDLQAKNLELDLLQDTKEDRVQMEWMLNGGGVLLFGLIVGLLLPFLPRRKKRKSGGW
nr:TIGR04211 family SH3 domain-containing protein [Psychromonas sp. CNPT3]